MRNFRIDHARLRRYLCAFFALVCIFFFFFSHSHGCHSADCPACMLQELLESILPAAVFTGLVKCLLALLLAERQTVAPGQSRTLVQLKVKLSD